MLGENMSQVQYLILTGSQKPYSDIDIFMVSDSGYVNWDLGWLDIYGRNIQELDEHVRNLDFSTCQRLLTGEILYGDEREFERIREKIRIQSITRDAILHNHRMSEEISNSSQNPKNKTAQTYRIAAKKMERGVKVLTLEDMLLSTPQKTS